MTKIYYTPPVAELFTIELDESYLASAPNATVKGVEEEEWEVS